MFIYIKLLISAVLITFASLGLGRFSYGMILPDLQNSLQISTTKIGFISTANFTGYLIAIFFISYLYKKYEAGLLISVSLALQGLSMVCMVFFYDYLYISFFYMISGFFAAIANVSIMIYISHVIPSNMKGKALGITVTGIGFAIMFTGYFVPYIETMISHNAWKTNWIVFSILVLLISFFIKAGLKQHDNKQHQTTDEKSTKELFASSKFYKIAFLYLAFGITYVVYVTFFVKANIDKYSINSYEAGFFWFVLGVMSIFSGPLFGSLSDKIGAYKTLIFIYAFLTTSNLLLVLNVESSFLWISAILFGVSAWAVPSLITLLSSQEFGAQNTAKVFSLATLIFASGQIVGPITAGYIYDIYNDFSNVFLLCAILTLFASICSLIFSFKKVMAN